MAVIPLRTAADASDVAQLGAPLTLKGCDRIYEFDVDHHMPLDLHAITESSELKKTIRLHWVVYPNLKAASESMARIVGAQWGRQLGVPLLVEGFEAATREAVRAVDEGEGHRAVFSSYLNALAGTLSQLAVHSTIGETPQGILEWDPLAVGFDDWVAGGAITRVCVYGAHTVDRDMLAGFKVKLLAMACSPKDLGIALRSMR